jgi:hypothetical protein
VRIRVAALDTEAVKTGVRTILDITPSHNLAGVSGQIAPRRPRAANCDTGTDS